MVEVKTQPGKSDEAEQYVKDMYPTVVLKEKLPTLVVLQLPRTINVAEIFKHMESAKSREGDKELDKQFIEDYSISQTTLDQLFISFAAQQTDLEDKDAEPQASIEPIRESKNVISIPDVLYQKNEQTDGTITNSGKFIVRPSVQNNAEPDATNEETQNDTNEETQNNEQHSKKRRSTRRKVRESTNGLDIPEVDLTNDGSFRSSKRSSRRTTTPVAAVDIPGRDKTVDDSEQLAENNGNQQPRFSTTSGRVKKKKRRSTMPAKVFDIQPTTTIEIVGDATTEKHKNEDKLAEKTATKEPLGNKNQLESEEKELEKQKSENSEAQLPNSGLNAIDEKENESKYAEGLRDERDDKVEPLQESRRPELPKTDHSPRKKKRRSTMKTVV